MQIRKTNCEKGYSIYKAIVFLIIYSTTDSWAEWMYTSY